MKIAIAGYGLEGESNYRYFSANPENDITIVDQHQPERDIPEGVNAIIGEDAFEQLENFDLVVRTAGLAPNKIVTNGKIWSATNEFFVKCPAHIIGVTGTKGKGTTASLISSILESAGKKVWLVGNIGNPALEVLDQIKSEDVVVYELSSFQLWDIKKSPQIAVILYIEQEHLDVHTSMEDYIHAKSNITRYQSEGDILVYNKNNQYADKIASSSLATRIEYPDDKYAHIKDGKFIYGEQEICSINSLHLLGNHNLENALAAIDATWNYVTDSKTIEKGLSGFNGLPHRLQFVREVDGVKYYDDSIATTPSSAIAALRSFSGPVTIILGGSSKGSDFSELGVELAKHEVKAIIIGDEAENIALACDSAGFKNYEIIQNPIMDSIVSKIHSYAKPGSTVLLSPASASFGLFKNYIDRGNQFIQAVNKLPS